MAWARRSESESQNIHSKFRTDGSGECVFKMPSALRRLSRVQLIPGLLRNNARWFGLERGPLAKSSGAAMACACTCLPT
eukprot:11902350-Alexandrium_andersonii.AAC.1